MLQQFLAKNIRLDDFPTLSELNDELRGRPDDTTVLLENTVQQGAEQLNIFNSCNKINDMSINNKVEVHTTTEDNKINQNMQRPNSIAELMAKIINPNFGNLFFINYQINGLTRKEWRLVEVQLTPTLQKKTKITSKWKGASNILHITS